MKPLNSSARILTPNDSLDQWDAFVSSSPQGSVFARSFWLRATARDRFQILTLRSGEEILAGWPMVFRSRRGRANLGMPPDLTPVLGILLGESNKRTYEGRLSEGMERISGLVALLPAFKRFNMTFHSNFTNWLPFYWAGFEQTTVYTYVISDLQDLAKVFSNFEHSKRKNLKKAERLVTVHEDMSAADLYQHHCLTLGKLGKKVRYSYDYFARIFQACKERDAGKTFYAVDSAQHVHAAIFVVYDGLSAYYLVSSIDPEFRESGATTLLIGQALTFLSPRTKKFDFEGSMIPGVERSFRKFGAVQTPLFRIRKDNRGWFERLWGSAKASAARTLERRGWRYQEF